MNMSHYDSKSIERKWSEYWEKHGTYKTENNDKPKSYVLDMFPYPSGDGLHVGHTRGYIATDVYSRYKRMSGFRVLHPMGWDAFGLPAERYALKNKRNPKDSVKKTIKRFKEQINRVGLSYDWDKEINTTDEKYYKWTQWTFIQMYKKGLVYPSNEPVLWCPDCKTSIAQEDLEGDKHERCGTIVEKKPIRQWVIKIRDYADRLLIDLDTLNEWPEHIKNLQKEWIGKGNGHSFSFEVKDSDIKVPVFTTRLDTLYGVAFISISPESEIALKLLEGAKNKKDALKYREKVMHLPDITRVQEEKEKDGVILKGINAIHPTTKEEIPIFLAAYVLASYGTGAVMGVPAHDTRDYNFAKEHKLNIKESIRPLNSDKVEIPFVEDGVLINSDEFSGVKSKEARIKIAKKINAQDKIFYKLRNWVFARQIYWGEPIPFINCADGSTQVLSEDQLPLTLPDVEHYEPTGTGESPLANIKEWVEVDCSNGKGRRETSTMPGWAGSSWYFLRFIDPHNDNKLVDGNEEKNWMPVDLYVGGAEHATRHLIYARFWHKFLYDIGVVSEEEPFKKLVPVGLLFRNGAKMSKSKGNVVDPIEVMDNVGADAYRLYIAFMGPFEKAIEWDDNGIVGTRRFLEKVFSLSDKISDNLTDSPEELNILFNQTIKKVTEDIEKLKLNTAVSNMMILVNKLHEQEYVTKKMYMDVIKLLAPFCPFITEEIWSLISKKEKSLSIHNEEWPKYDESAVEFNRVKVAIQVNGKFRGTVEADLDSTEDNILDLAKQNISIIGKIYKEGKPVRVIFIKNKILNILD